MGLSLQKILHENGKKDFSQKLDLTEHKLCMNNQMSNTGSGEHLVFDSN